MITNLENDIYDTEAERFNLIAYNLDRFTEIIETITNDDIKEKSKNILSQIENLVLHSPEWIFNNGLPSVNMGIFGSSNSGWKEILSVFINNEEQEYVEDLGIRVKHVLKFGEQSKHLLHIRHDSENMPDIRLSNWIDCGIFVFKLENERSFKDALLSHKELISFRRNNDKYAPSILVGCQDGVNKENHGQMKSYIELKEIAQLYGFDEYIEVRSENAYNTSFLFEFCTLLSQKCKYGRYIHSLTRESEQVIMIRRQKDDSTNDQKQRKSNKRKTCLDEDFKTPTTAPNNKKKSKNAKRTNSINDSTNDAERRLSFFKSKNKSLTRTATIETSSSFSSSSTLSEQIYPKLNRRYVSMIQLPHKKSMWKFFHRKKGNSSKDVIIPSENIVMQGILHKGRNKKWVTITNEPQMFYHNSKQDYLNGVTPKYIDLKLSNVKVPGNDCQNGHMFRASKVAIKKTSDEEENRTITINTNVGKSQCLTRNYKASSVEERNNWMTTIKDAIFHHYAQMTLDNKYHKQSSGDSVDSVLNKICKKFGNDHCAECRAKNPNWLVYNFGILICERCSGGHRNLGVEVSKVCSLLLDGMDKIRIEILESFGNTLFNSVMEATYLLYDDERPTPESASIDDWLKKKYIQRKYVAPLPLPNEEIQKQLIFAIQEEDRRYELICLMNCTKDELNLAYDKDKDSRTALMIAARLADIVSLQLLLWAGVDTSIKDCDGLNALGFVSVILHDDNQIVNKNQLLEIQDLLIKFKTPVQQLCKKL